MRLGNVARICGGLAALWLGGAWAQEPPTPPALEFAFEVRAEVATPTVVGEVPAGTRRIVDILGGTVAGPKVKEIGRGHV